MGDLIGILSEWSGADSQAKILTSIRSVVSTPPSRVSSPPSETRPRLELPRMIHHYTSRTPNLAIPTGIHAIMPSIPRFRIHSHILIPHSFRSTRCLSVAYGSLLGIFGNPMVWGESAFDPLRRLYWNRLVLDLHFHCLLRCFCRGFRYRWSHSRARYNGFSS